MTGNARVSPRLFLHSARVELVDSEGSAVDVSAPLPADLTTVLQNLEEVE